MPHPASNQLKTVQEMANAAWNINTGTFSVSAMNGGYTYNNITTSAQTTVKSSAGILGKVAINVFSLTSSVRLYDNTVSGGNIIATLPAGVSGNVYDFETRFTTGLTVSTGAAADNITVIYN